MAQVIENVGGGYRNRTGLHGFAIREKSDADQDGYVSNDAPTNRERIGNVSTDDLTTTNENPGATAIATGAECACEEGQLRKKEYSKPTRSAMSKYALDRHKRAARAFGYALTLGDEAAWQGHTTILKARLTDRENAAAAMAHLMALEPDQVAVIFEALQPVSTDPWDTPAFRDAVAEYRQSRGRGMAA